MKAKVFKSVAEKKIRYHVVVQAKNKTEAGKKIRNGDILSAKEIEVPDGFSLSKNGNSAIEEV